ncbi:MAG: glycosyltransferase, partial [Candidatus Woesebacteria bacterium]|nr:glycosyltransferase [Candidatus Woesebacteria bacterium]
KYDLIIPTNGRFQVIAARIITWLTGGKMIVSGQSGMGWDDRINLYSFPDYFVALSNTALQWAKRINPLVKSVYIPNGVDLKKFTINNSKLTINLKRPIILCVAALTKTKRIDLVIKAVSKLEDASLLIVGKGEEEKNLQTLGTRLLGNRFRITSFPYEKMPEVYRTADVFTLVSESYYSFE